MKRRLNYTDRKRIMQTMVSIRLNRDDQGQVESFGANIDIDELALPGSAKVFIEAYYRTEQKRYSFGTVEKIERPKSTSLSELAYGENLKFRLLVIGDNGKILAAADRIKPEGMLDESILPVVFEPLEQQVWKLQYGGDDGAPILKLNSAIPEIKNIARKPVFIFHIYPSVLREVLTHLVFIDMLTDQNEPDVDWQEKWLKFAAALVTETPNLCVASRDFDGDAVEDWIEEVVQEFCVSRSDWKEFTDGIEASLNDKT